jgi:hypothetical protein
MFHDMTMDNNYVPINMQQTDVSDIGLKDSIDYR